MAKKRVWKVDVIQDEGGLFPINRGYTTDTREGAEHWLESNLKWLATPDPYGNYPYTGRRPVKVLKTRIHAEWEEQNRTKYYY